MTDNRNRFDNEKVQYNKLFNFKYGLDYLWSLANEHSIDGKKVHQYLPAKPNIKIGGNRQSVVLPEKPDKQPIAFTNKAPKVNDNEIKKNTRLLENMVKDMLLDMDKVDIYFSRKNPQTIKVRYKNKSALGFHFRKKTYNLTEILRTADINQIKLDDHDKNNYVAHCQKNHFKNLPTIASENLFTKKIERYFKNDKEKIEKYKGLHFAEKMSINIYSGQAHENINKLLRGVPLDAKNNALKPNDIKELLLHATMSIGTINKHAERINCTMRVDYNMDIDLINKKQQGDFQEKGLISTAYAESKFIQLPRLKEKGSHCLTYFPNVVGFLAAPLCHDESEREYLLTPSKVQYELKHVNNRENNNLYIFEAKQLGKGNTTPTIPVPVETHHKTTINKKASIKEILPLPTMPEEKTPMTLAPSFEDILEPLPPLPSLPKKSLPPLPPLPKKSLPPLPPLPNKPLPPLPNKTLPPLPLPPLPPIPGKDLPSAGNTKTILRRLNAHTKKPSYSSKKQGPALSQQKEITVKTVENKSENLSDGPETVPTNNRK